MSKHYKDHQILTPRTHQCVLSAPSTHSPLIYYLSAWQYACVYACVFVWVALRPAAVSPTVSDSQDTNGFHTDWLLYLHTQAHKPGRWWKIAEIYHPQSLSLWKVKGQVQKSILHGKHNCRRSLTLPRPPSFSLLFILHRCYIKKTNEKLEYTLKNCYSDTVLLGDCQWTLIFNNFVSKCFAKNTLWALLCVCVRAYLLHQNSPWVKQSESRCL